MTSVSSEATASEVLTSESTHSNAR